MNNKNEVYSDTKQYFAIAFFLHFDFGFIFPVNFLVFIFYFIMSRPLKTTKNINLCIYVKINKVIRGYKIRSQR